MLAGLPALSPAQNSKRLTVPGINNFWFVDKTVSTGGSITSRDMAMPALKKRGIKTVIDLAGGAQSDAERTATEAAGMKYLVFPINPMTLDPAPIEPFLRAASDPANFPVFIHSGNGHRAGMGLMIKRVLVMAGRSRKRASKPPPPASSTTTPRRLSGGSSPTTTS